jgi:3-hydroxyisobutyryl-CoA hydrolase
MMIYNAESASTRKKMIRPTISATRRLYLTFSHLAHTTTTTPISYTSSSMIRHQSTSTSSSSSKSSTSPTASPTSSDSEKQVLSKVYDVSGLGHIHLNRPKALNSLNIVMCEEILKYLSDWKNNNNIRSILITGEGRALCAGGDIRSLAFPPEDQWAERFFKLEYTMNYALATYNKPIVAIQHGIVMGGGVGISVHGKYRVATDDTVFAMPETGIGLFTDVGATYFLPRLPDSNGVFMAMTGYRCSGADIVFLGIATHFVPKDKIPSLIETLQKTKYDDVKEVLDRFNTKPSEASKLEQQQEYIAKSFNTFSVDEIFENLKKQQQNGKDEKEREWAAQQLKILKGKSRTSMEVTIEGLKRGKHESLAECLKREYRMGVRTARAKGDFREGVRALIVDKDNKPKWNPPPTTSEVAKYFVDFKQDDESNVSDLELPKHSVQGL